MKPRMAVMAMLALAGLALGAMAVRAEVPAGVDGVLGLYPVGSQTCIAVEIQVPADQELTGLRWYNNDAGATFAQVVVMSGQKGVAPVLGGDGLTVASIAAPSSGWGELTLPSGVSSETGTLHAVFILPAGGEREGEGQGGGAGIGYWAHGGGAATYLSQDGVDWVELSGAVTLAVEPVLQAAAGGMRLSSSRGGGNGEGVGIVNAQEAQSAAGEQLVTALQVPAPNPFNPRTEIRFSLKEPGEATLTVYNLRGAVVRRLMAETLAAGQHVAVWAGTDDGGRPVASGIYLVKLVAGGIAQTQRLTLVR